MSDRERFSRAERVIPGGVNSPVRAFRAVQRTPVFIRRGKGAYLYGEDGKKYLDYVMSWGPLILGHAHRKVVQAVVRAAEGGLTFGAPTVRETALAEEILYAAPYADKVRLVSSGTEATMSAVRLCRGYTGRDKIVKFAGNYHGHSDGLLVKAGSGCLTGAAPDSDGVPRGYAEQTLVAAYNDLAGVRALFEAYPRRIACVIVEPVAANMGVVSPAEGFLQGLRALCTQFGALLVFDEVITGFRVAYGGAAERYGVSPDVVAFGKIVGGGMPLAAYAGRGDVMACVAPVGKVYQAGTLSGNPVATAAGLTTLRLLRASRDTLYPALEQKGALLEKAFRRAGVSVGRVGSLLTPFFASEVPRCEAEARRCDTQAYADYFGGMLDAGVYVAPSQFEAMFVSAAHTDAMLRRTAEIAERAAADALRRAAARPAENDLPNGTI